MPLQQDQPLLDCRSGRCFGENVNGDYPQMRALWDNHRLTGDNTKERPYAALYQHLTTRSNSYEVQVLAPTIIKSTESTTDVFDPAQDAIGEEYRGKGTPSLSVSFEITNTTLDPMRHPNITSRSVFGDTWEDITTVVSQGDSTSFTDNSSPNVARPYYRIVTQ